MGLPFYTLAELREAGKTVLRALLPTVATEDKSDAGLILNTSAQLFQGSQVAAAHVFDQILPRRYEGTTAVDADASTLEEMLERHAIDFTKPATKARGYALVSGGASFLGSIITKGTTITMPEGAYPDGTARTYVVTEDALPRATGTTVWSATVIEGSTRSKIRVRDLTNVRAGDAIQVDSEISCVRRVSYEDSSVELWWPISDWVAPGATIGFYTDSALVAIEAQEAGAAGNVQPSQYLVESSSDTRITKMRIAEIGGGGDAQSSIDSDRERVIRTIEDTIAGAPGGGNPQHIRELALSCPDTDADDAVVYMHARGPGTVDVVLIGRKKVVYHPSFPDARVDHLHFGGNGRRVGSAHAAIVEAWLKERLSYFDDVRVRSVEHDRSGPRSGWYNSTNALRSELGISIVVTPSLGYGPDSGVSLSYTGSTTEPNRLPTAAPIDARIKSGHRVAVTIFGAPETTGYPAMYVQFVTRILAIAPDRSYATIAEHLPISRALYMPRTISFPSYAVQWRTCGPLHAPVLAAAQDYFADLGPGSYLVPPKDPGYQDAFGAALPAFSAGVGIDRWPSEGRRWASSFRVSKLRAKILEVKGVRDLVIQSGGNEAINDYDPLPFYTLQPSGIEVLYA